MIQDVSLMVRLSGGAWCVDSMQAILHMMKEEVASTTPMA